MTVKTLSIVILVTTLWALPCSAAAHCPADVDSTGCLYFKAGYQAGRDDARNGATAVYPDRDDRFEKTYARGYIAGWNKTQAEAERKSVNRATGKSDQSKD